MEIIVAKSSGFCYGVARAVSGVYNELGKKDMICLGPIIHNKTITDDLERKNVPITDDPLSANERTVVIRAHGVGRKTYLQMEDAGIDYIDFTCKDVKKIHNIVADYSKAGYEIIIIGDSRHPEITGVAGWAEREPIIINSVEEARLLDINDKIKYAVVVQTTYPTDEFNRITNALKEKINNLEINNTICPATEKRQKEAEELSKKVTKMIVLGDKLSANTRKLYEISKKNCKNTYFVQSIKELQLNNFVTNDIIGITAGASTPPEIIKEAVIRMSELDNNVNDQTFEEMLDESFVTLHTGDVVKGTVIQIAGGEVSVNLGYKSDGVIPRTEFSDDPNVDPKDAVKIGDEIEVFVIRVNDGEGNVLLSRKRLEVQKGYTEIEEAFNNKTTVKGRVSEIVKGGLISMVKGVRVFIPSSQISSRYVENLEQFKGQEYDFSILEFDRSKRRVVGGRRDLAVQEENSKKEKLFSSIEEGQKLEGVVSRIVDFGAFVDIGGADGLIHISEMSWGRVKKVTDVLKEGDHVTVTVLKVDKDKEKISLSLKDVNENPWSRVEEKYPIGSIVEGTVVRMVTFGVFVELEPGVDGLVHISQIAQKHVVKPEDELTIGESISVKVVDIDKENKKISLSKKEADAILNPQPVEDVIDEVPVVEGEEASMEVEAHDETTEQ
ncbi:bifunctional 4-hydroxy-3-methylbut-2-enyl diphosphate reductase/30S ribosomal protein S1 [Tyzzerella sp. OttesenSCG-928-J15]|nr:bifunctional 4-hydroxy-3-methylbut-2-enyl diphosphate reductase/30S ribosomal protein S1 [Tyzzerella sp. OttesenSCG-928-J15]